MKRYRVTVPDSTMKSYLKQTLMGVGDYYQRYIEQVNPENAYSLEDIELAIDKLLKLN